MSEVEFKLIEDGDNVNVVKFVDNEKVSVEQSFSLYDDYAYTRAGCAKRDLEGGSGKSANKIISDSYREAAMRNCSPVDFIHDDETEYGDIVDSATDFREDKDARGVIVNCHYCGTACLFDDDGESEDYEVGDSFHHCDGCMNNAIIRNCL